MPIIRDSGAADTILQIHLESIPIGKCERSYTIFQNLGDYEGREGREDLRNHLSFFAPFVVTSLLSDCFWKMVLEPE